jgi:hypothetical protein
VITLRADRLRAARTRRQGWPLVAAAAVTYGSFTGVLLSLRYVAGASPVSSRHLHTSPERIVLIIPRIAQARADDEPVVASERPVAVARASLVVRPVPPDTGGARTSASMRATASTSPSAALSPDAVARLTRPRPELGGGIAVPLPRDRFAPPTVPTAIERDSVLIALSTMVLDLAARRVPTRAELDSRAKEATLKMRLAGRPLLVPPDNSGGLITARIPWPGGPSKRRRARDARSHDEGSARLRRLLARVDSLRRAREDSLRGATVLVP